VPVGLAGCTSCGEWRGECLAPSVLVAPLVVAVHCRCANHNLCARCGELLYERRLDANYYNPRDGQVWHVPGFCALRHPCGGL